MPLTEVQLKFIEKYVLRRKLVEIDLAGGDEGMREGTKGADLATEAHELMRILATMKPPPGASPELTVALGEHEKAVRHFLDHPLQMSGVRAAAAEIKAMGDSHARAIDDVTERGKTVEALGLRVTNALEALDKEPLKPDADEAARQKGEIDKGLTAPPPQSGQLVLLDQAVVVLETLVKDANQRAADDRQKRTEAATKLRNNTDDLKSKLDVEAAEPGRTELEKALDQLVKAMTGTPSQQALDDAGKAMVIHVETARKANEEADEKRKARAKRRTDLLLLAKATVPDATEPEANALGLAAGKVTTALPDPASAKDIETAEKAYLDFHEQLRVLTEAVKTRRDLVEKGNLALARLEWNKGIFVLPDAASTGRAGAIKEDAEKLATEGARYGRMDEAHEWGDKDLVDFGKKIDALETRAKDLTKEVEESAKKVSEAAKAARDAVDAPKSGWSYSVNQKKDFESRIVTAEKAGTAKMDDAAEALKTLTMLKAAAEDLARRLTALATRIGKIDAAPADALDQEKNALAAAKKKATEALNEVLAE